MFGNGRDRQWHFEIQRMLMDEADKDMRVAAVKATIFTAIARAKSLEACEEQDNKAIAAQVMASAGSSIE